MKFGAYFAYWEKEWDADYMRYCQKFADIGFDVLEVSGAGLYEMNEQQLIALKDEAARCGVKLTGCIGRVWPTKVRSAMSGRATICC